VGPSLNHIAPAQLARRGVHCVCGTQGGDVERPSDHEEPTAEPAWLIELCFADPLQCTDVSCIDLIKVHISLTRVVLVDGNPIVRTLREACEVG
jgi:hypothetical protein